jgi:hypothetical protein
LNYDPMARPDSMSGDSETELHHKETLQQNSNAMTDIPTENPTSNRRKRQRISQACDQCRKRKSRCDGKRPVCAICGPLKRKCTYGINGKKRGLQTGHVRGLEILWGLVFNKVQGSEETVRTLLRDDFDGVSIENWYKEMARDGEAPQSLLDAWRKSTLAKEMEKLLTAADDSDSSDKEGRKGSALLEPMEFSGPMSWSVDDPAITATERPFHNFDKAQPFLGPYEEHPPIHSNPMQPGMAAPANTWRLLEIYFSYTHCWLPILEKHDILKTSYTVSTDAGPGNSCSGRLAAFWAVLAYTSAQCKSLDINATEPKRFYFYALSFIPTHCSEYELSHTQALILLSLFQLGGGSPETAWNLIGQAIRIGISVGFHKPSDGNTKGRQGHAFWGSFVLDTFLSAVLGRSSYLSSEDSKAVGLVEEDGLDEWDPWIDAVKRRNDYASTRGVPAHSLSIFNQLILCSSILADITKGKPHSSAPGQVLSSLKKWKANLPPHCTITSGSAMRPAVLHLHLIWTSTLSILKFYDAGLPSTQVRNHPEMDGIPPRSLQLLRQYIDTFGTICLPPTFGTFASLALRHATSTSPPSTSDRAGWVSIEKALTHIASLMDKQWGSIASAEGSGNTSFTQDIPIAQTGRNESSSTQSVQQTDVGAIVIPTDRGLNEFAYELWTASAALDEKDHSLDLAPDPKISAGRTPSLHHAPSLASPIEARSTPSTLVPGYPITSPYGFGTGEMAAYPSYPHQAESYSSFLDSDVTALFDEIASLGPTFRYVKRDLPAATMLTEISTVGQPQFIHNLGFTEPLSPNFFSSSQPQPE